ncbi:hypothetical protein ACLBXI_25645 [Bacillus cereus]
MKRIPNVKGEQNVFRRVYITLMDIVKKANHTMMDLIEWKSKHAIVLGSRSFKTVIHKGA